MRTVAMHVIFCLLYQPYYRSILLAHLAVIEYENPMDDFQDLLDNDMIVPLSKGCIRLFIVLRIFFVTLIILS